jgi:maltooligosyltrehalose trehalohydrolase
MNQAFAPQRLPGWELPIGAQMTPHGVRFSVWAPDHEQVSVVLFHEHGKRTEHQLDKDPKHQFGYGHFTATIPGIGAGQQYKFRLGKDEIYPDPASRSQPYGPGGASEVIDPKVAHWTDAKWEGVSLDNLVLYEAHIGTATPKGTFDEFISCLGDIRDLGATAILLMPVVDFSGSRNWGYDGVSLFAPTSAYGGPNALRRLVDAAHRYELGVILDVVFSHMGADCNYLEKFSRRYLCEPSPHDKWGPRLNVGPFWETKPIRQFLKANAAYWAHEYHIDGLRLDAIHAFPKGEESGVVGEIAQFAKASLPPGRKFLVLADDERRDVDLVNPLTPAMSRADALCADDFHHQVFVSLSGLKNGYHIDFNGTAEDLAQTMNQSLWFDGSIESIFQTRIGSAPRPGGDTTTIPAASFVWCLENHDQTGNRPLGERFRSILRKHRNDADAAYRMASALLLLSPATPLIFMGQEWAASTPFLYFSDIGPWFHRDVREGRVREYREREFPENEFADQNPFAAATFQDSKLRWSEREKPGHAAVHRLYRRLLCVRQNYKIAGYSDRMSFHVKAKGDTLLLRWGPYSKPAMIAIANLKESGGISREDLALNQNWKALVNTESADFGGTPDSYFEKPSEIGFHGPGFVLFGEERAAGADIVIREPWCKSALLKEGEPANNSDRFKWDVFLSFAEKDKAAMEILREASPGKERVFAASFDAGDRWANELKLQIEKSHRFAILLTEVSTKKPWVNYELGLAVANGKTIIGIRQGADLAQLQGLPLSQFHLIEYGDLLKELQRG